MNKKYYKINLMSKSHIRWLRKQKKKPTTTLNYISGTRSFMRVPIIWNYIAKQRVLLNTAKRLKILSEA